MGEDFYGQLGDGNGGEFVTTNLPEQIITNNVIAIACGAMHSLFLKTDGSLWGMGYNGYGQLGDGTLNDTNLPEEIVSSGVTAISAAGNHSLFLKSDGSLWAMGWNEWGQLGDGFTNDTSSPEQIYPSLQPVLTNNILSTTTLQFNATCQFGGTFYLLAGTNLMQTNSQWTPLATNIITDRNNNLFSATLSNAVNLGVGQRFYILQSQ